MTKRIFSIFVVITMLTTLFVGSENLVYADDPTFGLELHYDSNYGTVDDIDYIHIIDNDNNTVIQAINENITNPMTIPNVFTDLTTKQYTLVYKKNDGSAERSMLIDNTVLNGNNVVVHFGVDLPNILNLNFDFPWGDINELFSSMTMLRVVYQESDAQYEEGMTLLQKTSDYKLVYENIPIKGSGWIWVEYKTLYDTERTEMYPVSAGVNNIDITLREMLYTPESPLVVYAEPSVIIFDERYVDYTDVQEKEVIVRSNFNEPGVESQVTFKLNSLEVDPVNGGSSDFTLHFQDGRVVGKSVVDSSRLSEVTLPLSDENPIVFTVRTNGGMNVGNLSDQISIEPTLIPRTETVDILFSVKDKPISTNHTYNFTAQPTNFDFGEKIVGYTIDRNEFQELVITNTGDYPLYNIKVKPKGAFRIVNNDDINNFRLGGAFFNEGTILKLNPNKSHKLKVGYGNFGTGLWDYDLDISVSTPNELLSTKLKTKLNVVTKPFDWKLEPTSIDFGKVKVGYTNIAEQDIYLKNNEPLTKMTDVSMAIRGVDADKFIFTNSTSGDIVNFATETEVNSMTTKVYKVKPKLGLPVGNYTIILDVVFDDTAKSVPIQFQVGEPERVDFKLQPNVINFENRTVGYDNPPKVKVAFTNTGNKTLDVINLTITGENVFKIVDNANQEINQLQNINIDETVDFYVMPNIGLGAKNYKAKLSVLTNGVLKDVPIDFTVVEKPKTDTGMPPVIERVPIRPEYKEAPKKPDEEMPKKPDTQEVIPPPVDNEEPPTIVVDKDDDNDTPPVDIVKPPKTGIGYEHKIVNNSILLYWKEEEIVEIQDDKEKV